MAPTERLGTFRVGGDALVPLLEAIRLAKGEWDTEFTCVEGCFVRSPVDRSHSL